MPSLIFATIMLPFALMLSVFTGMLMAATILFALQLPYVIVGAAWLVSVLSVSVHEGERSRS